MNLLLLSSHAVLEYDDLRMFADLGYDVFCPGGYEDPAHPAVDTRPALPDAPDHPELRALCHDQRVKHAGESAEYAIDWAKADLHPGLIDWADVIIVSTFPDRWIARQWNRLLGKRVIWRTIGQSMPDLEDYMAAYRAQGLSIVRYSPAERRAFEPLGRFAGEDAMIRFGKYPADWGPWTGQWTVWHNDLGPVVEPDGSKGKPFVGNVTQNMVQRGEACGLSFWLAATEGLEAVPAGPGSEELHGLGPLTYDRMRQYLVGCRAYLYTGTKPASYTYGLIEAMLSGVPVVSIGGEAWGWSELFEADELTGESHDDADVAHAWLRGFLLSDKLAPDHSEYCRQVADDLFSVATVGPQWRDFLGSPRIAASWSQNRQTVTA